MLDTTSPAAARLDVTKPQSDARLGFGRLTPNSSLRSLGPGLVLLFLLPFFLLPQLLLFVLFLVFLATLVSHGGIMPHYGRWMKVWLCAIQHGARTVTVLGSGPTP